MLPLRPPPSFLVGGGTAQAGIAGPHQQEASRATRKGHLSGGTSIHCDLYKKLSEWLCGSQPKAQLLLLVIKEGLIKKKEVTLLLVVT